MCGLRRGKQHGGGNNARPAQHQWRTYHGPFGSARALNGDRAHFDIGIRAD
jgi:hypothetical protein